MRGAICLALLLGLVGCWNISTADRGQPTAVQTVKERTASAVLSAPLTVTKTTAFTVTLAPTPSRAWAFPGTQAPPLPSQAPPERSPAPTPSSTRAPSSALAVISPANMSSLQKLGEIDYQPWELVMALAWSSSGNRLAVAAGEHVHIVSTQTGQEEGILEIGAWTVGLEFLRPDSHLALATKDGYWQLWDISTGKRLCRVFAHQKGANNMALSPDGQRLASTGNDGIVRIWDITGTIDGKACPEKPVAEMIGGAFAVSDIRFSPDGERIASVDAHTIFIRETASQRLDHTLMGENSIFGIAYSPDGSRLASAEMAGIARLWDTRTGKAAPALLMPGGKSTDPGLYLWRVTFSPDGSILAGSGSDGSITLWEVPGTPEQESSSQGEGAAYRFIAHARAATGVLFSPDGKVLVTGGLDGKVCLWGVIGVK